MRSTEGEGDRVASRGLLRAGPSTLTLAAARLDLPRAVGYGSLVSTKRFASK